MKKDFDGRSLSHDTLEYIRIQAVKSIRKGIPIKTVSIIFGIHISRIYAWIQRANKKGINDLRAKPIPGKQPILTVQQKNILILWMCSFTPLDFDYGTTLWTISIVKTLIEKKFSINMSHSAVGRFLHSCELTPQHPIYRAIERRTIDVNNWVHNEFPKIKMLAKEEGAVIYFLDEAGVRTDYHAGTTWSLKGLTPIVPATGGRYRINMIAAITSEGKLHFQIGPHLLNGHAFVEYLKALTQDDYRPIWIIMDGCSIHHAKIVNEYIEMTKGKIKIFFLPTYSPHLNPVELLWNNIKAQGIARYLIRNVKELQNKATQLLESLQSTPEKIRTFFNEESVRYAI